MQNKYEIVVGGFTFMMVDDNTIEIWGGGEFPDSFIYLRDGEITNKVQFEKEVGFWIMRNT